MSTFRIRKREEPWKWGALVTFPGALLFSLSICALLLLWQDKSVWQGMQVLWAGTFGETWALEEALLKAVPIFLCSLGVAVAFRMQIWNIGAEGQFALGAIGASWMALTFPGLPHWVLIPLMFLMALVLGSLWALVPAFLRLRLKVNEIISTLMLNYIAILLIDYLVLRVWKDPSGFPVSPEFSSAALIGKMYGRIHWGIALCVACGFAVWAFMRFTRLGYELKASGEGARVARYAKLPYSFLVMFVMGVSGALAGWAGALEISAVVGRLQPSVMAGYGYTAIVVAWLAQLQPLAIAVVAFLLAALRVGAENLQIELQIPAAFGVIMEGLILLTVLAAQFFSTYTIERRREGEE
ncbi:ABC transporter permease [Paucidesulfovibrio longus]|uniref:ABC transporter permease n=1 Tax=Paucidesulfovibrio longus TaxID=889 RepID=UPI0003B7727E|nr:ABC transporter permease [Paucidesulfovibrio longus]